MTDWIASVATLQSPLLIALALAATTLLFEDLAIAAGVALAAQGAVSWTVSILAVAGGIAIGDLLLFALGLGATRLRWLARWRADRHPRSAQVQRSLARNLASAVLVARVVPGLRLVTYTACGYLRLPLARFAAWVLLAVALWTLALYGLGVAAGLALAHALGLPLPVAVALPILALAVAVPLWQRWRRRPPQSSTAQSGR